MENRNLRADYFNLVGRLSEARNLCGFEMDKPYPGKPDPKGRVWPVFS